MLAHLLVLRSSISIKTRLLNLAKLVPNKSSLSPPKLNSPLSTGILKCASIGTGSYLLLQSAYCDRLTQSRKKYAQDQFMINNERKRDEEAAVDWTDFLSMLYDQKWFLLIAFGSALVVAWINIEIPHLLGKLVDLVTTSSSTDFISKLKTPALKCVKLYLIQAAATFSYILSLSISGERMAHILRVKYFKSMMNQSVEFYDSHMTGEILGRLTSDIQEFKSCFKQAFSQGLRSFSQSVGCIWSMYLISPGLAQGMLLLIPSVILIGASLGSFLRSLSRHAAAQLSLSASLADEAFSNIRTVKGFGMEENEEESYGRESGRLERINIRLASGIGIFQAGSNLLLNSIILSILYFGGQKMSSNEVSGGELMAFMVAAQTIQKSLANLSQVYGYYIKGLECLARVQEFIRLDAGPRPGNIYPLKQLDGDVEFKDVVFRYKDREPVLKKLNLKLEKGKVTALVGGSGSGKSTIVSLLQVLQSPQEGSVEINGINCQLIDPNQLNRDLIGVISQEPILFATSILENIRYGKPNASEEEVYLAAKKANAYDFIQSFPKGFHTVLGEKGTTVSGGQKQRIAIARALIKNPSILILDEATSALDSESERLIKETLDAEMKGRTVLVIAHRLSTIKNSDQIAVISRGKIVEFGSHEKLISAKGLYYHMVQSQNTFS